MHNKANAPGQAKASLILQSQNACPFSLLVISDVSLKRQEICALKEN
jgi:hypothetical protein